MGRLCSPSWSCLALGVVALQEEDGKRIGKSVAKIADMEVATQHGDDLCGVLESIYADEVWVVATCKVPDCACLDFWWPLRYHQNVANVQ